MQSKPRIFKDSAVPNGPWHVAGGEWAAHLAACDFAARLNGVTS